MELKQKFNQETTTFPFLFLVALLSGFIIPMRWERHLQAPPLHLSTNQDPCIKQEYNCSPMQSVYIHISHSCSSLLFSIATRCSPTSIPFTSGTRLHLSMEKEMASSRAEVYSLPHHQHLDTIRGEFISRQTSWDPSSP